MNYYPSIKKRAIAFLIDYCIILLYIAALVVASFFINSIFPFWEKVESKFFTRHLISFFTLTLPVLIYFIRSEYKLSGTIGKRKLNLKVVDSRGLSPSLGNIIIRNCIKFLPWELSHLFINLFMPHLIGDEPPFWMIFMLYLPIILVFSYLIVAIIRNDSRSIYELMSNTKVVVDNKFN